MAWDKETVVNVTSKKPAFVDSSLNANLLVVTHVSIAGRLGQKKGASPDIVLQNH